MDAGIVPIGEEVPHQVRISTDGLLLQQMRMEIKRLEAQLLLTRAPHRRLGLERMIGQRRLGCSFGYIDSNLHSKRDKSGSSSCSRAAQELQDQQQSQKLQWQQEQQQSQELQEQQLLQERARLRKEAEARLLAEDETRPISRFELQVAVADFSLRLSTRHRQRKHRQSRKRRRSRRSCRGSRSH